MTNKEPQKLHLLAEWDDRFDSVMVAWPHALTDWNYMLDQVCACYRELIVSLCGAGLNVVVVTPDRRETDPHIGDLDSPRLKIVEAHTNDTWIRDYGPLTLGSPGAGEYAPAPGTCGPTAGRAETSAVTPAVFTFNGWGLKFASNLDNRVSAALLERAGMAYADNRPVVLEGGSIESDGLGTILTTTECLLSANRNNFRSKAEAETMLSERLGATRVLWLDHGALEGDDTDSHVDTLARLLPGDTIAYVKSYRPDDPHTPELDAMERQLTEMTTADGRPYNLVGLPLPEPCLDPETGERLPATYANFLITPKGVFMPTYGQPKNDLMARQMLEMALGDRPVIGVDCRALIRQHGSLHCATMQITNEIFNRL